MQIQMVDPQLNHSVAQPSGPTSNRKPVVVGVYGVQGCGKTTLLNKLKEELDEQIFAFYDGSGMIAEVAGSLGEFQKLDEKEKELCRQRAIDKIGKNCAESGKVGIVAGHFMFWSEEESKGKPIYTQNDMDTYTHILYLDVPAADISKQRLNDTERKRSSVSANDLHKWQEAEKTELRSICRDHDILFMPISRNPKLVDQVSALLIDFKDHDEKCNLTRAENRLDEVFLDGRDKLETVLVLDADRTLAAEDTGTMFWNRVFHSRRLGHEVDPLKTLFSGPLKYSYTAFRQAMLMYEETGEECDTFCEDVASGVTMHPEFVSLLQKVAKLDHVRAVIVTCGMRSIWEKVLVREGLSHTVKVIGGGRIEDGFVVTAAVKAALVSRLQDVHRMYVWAFGDSVLDLEMMRKANRAIVVVGEEHTRSKSMDAALNNAITDGLQVQQVLLPSTASPRLNVMKLPRIHFSDHKIMDSILRRRSQYEHVFHVTDTSAAKMLMTPTRDAAIAGPALREAHRRVGWYLAIEWVADVIGVEEYSIPHVQGGNTTGYRLRDEAKTSIVPLMRGGEPMAFGVSDAFPLARFVHASSPEDLKFHHLEGQQAVVLVDSVVNSGKSVVEFVAHVRKLHSTIRIVVVAGVVQEQSVSKGSLAQTLADDKKLSIVALRLSENKFTGSGTTDTGNRLFNTTHLA